MLLFDPSKFMQVLNAEFFTVTFDTPPPRLPPAPDTPSTMKLASPEPKLNRIVGIAPSALRTVIALFVPDHVP